jgi:electron transfer flavoprotein beta subunit
VTGLKGLTVSGGTARCEQESAGARDIYEVPMPAVLGVLEGLNLPRYPSVPGRIRAKSKPIATSEPPRPAARLEMVKLVVPPVTSSQAEVLGSGPEAAPAVVELLASLGVL